MHINIDNGQFNPNECDKLFRQIYTLCERTPCNKCPYRNGEWIIIDGNLRIRCETALLKQNFKNGENNGR